MSEPSEGTREQSPEDVLRITPSIPAFATGDTVPGLSSWLLERKIGGGGFGEVWLTRHAWNVRERPRAVKFCTDPAARHRLVTHEKNVVLRVMKYATDHPNVVPLLDCNLDGDIPWLMYEFVEGGTLAGAIKEWRELSLPQRLGKAVRTLHAIASALARFHRFDPPLVHRDMKPHNVLMADKVPRITDFGIGSVVVTPQNDNATGSLTAYAARLPSALHSAGTRIYAPPEQMLGSTPNPRDDVYALGIIAYQMVMADLTAVPGADATLELRDLKVPAELVALIVRSVSINPDRRPKDATEWEQKLGAVVERKQKQHETTDTSSGPTPALPPLPAATERPRARTEMAPILPPPAPLPPARAESAPVPPTKRPPARPEEAPILPREPIPQPLTRPKQRKRKQGTSLAVSIVSGVVALLVLIVCFVVFARHPRPSVSTASKPIEPKPSVPSPGVPPKPVVPESNPGKLVPRPGETREVEIADGVFMTFCWVPAGECQLGSPKDERDAVLKALNETKEPDWLQAEAEERRGKFHTNGFWLGKYEVTQAEWAAVMRGTAIITPSAFRVGGKGAGKLGAITDTSRYPVESVSWHDCNQFLSRTNAHGGISKAFGKPGEFALPHEDAWEYACRGGLGNQKTFYFGKELNGTQANIDGNYPFGTTTKGPYLERTAAVGSYEKKFPHPWGLCDMHGNVWEWCNNSDGMTRSGCWFHAFKRSCRAAVRMGANTGYRGDQIGFRVLVTGL